MTRRVTLEGEAVDELFPGGLLDDMFAAYRDLVGAQSLVSGVANVG